MIDNWHSYSIGVKQKYPHVKDVRLIWHFLKFDRKIDSARTDDDLEELKQNIIQLIDAIESANEFPANHSRLCEWCKFKSTCRTMIFNHGGCDYS